MRYLRVVCCPLVMLSACSAVAEPERVAEVELAIQAGVVDSAFPAVGALWGSGSPLCTATLISPYLVLTAAHCLEFQTTFYTGTGEALPLGPATPPPNITAHAIVAQAAHPSHVPNSECAQANTGHDIALMALQDPITNITPFEAIRRAPGVSAGQACTAVGYGLHGSTAGQRRRASVEVTIAGYLNNPPLIEIKAAGAESGLSDSGDSGGPLLCVDPATLTTGIAGITWCHSEEAVHVREIYTPIAASGGSIPSVAAGALPALAAQRAYFGDTSDPAAAAMKLLGITLGCAASPPLYCPSDLATRGAIAIFVIRALYGEAFSASSSAYFSDVAPSDAAFPYVQKLRDLGITTGCTATTYCPNTAITRGQLAVFLVRARFGDNFSFPGSPVFSDVLTDHPYFKYVQKAFEQGILGGCVGAGFCPDASMTRGEVAGPLVKALIYRN